MKGEDLHPIDKQSFCFYCSCVVAWWCIDIWAAIIRRKTFTSFVLCVINGWIKKFLHVLL